MRPYAGALLLATLAASGAAFVACGGGDHEFASESTDTSVDDTNKTDGTGIDTLHVDTNADSPDDVPSSSK